MSNDGNIYNGGWLVVCKSEQGAWISKSEFQVRVFVTELNAELVTNEKCLLGSMHSKAKKKKNTENCKKGLTDITKTYRSFENLVHVRCRFDKGNLRTIF